VSNLNPIFDGIINGIIKSHLQGQNIVARKRDVVRFNALQKGWQECGDLISFGTFVAAVDAYERARDEADLEKQYEYERSRDTRQAKNDDLVEAEICEKRERDAQRARS
jgi:hypothetical protein